MSGHPVLPTKVMVSLVFTVNKLNIVFLTWNKVVALFSVYPKTILNNQCTMFEQVRFYSSNCNLFLDIEMIKISHFENLKCY